MDKMDISLSQQEPYPNPSPFLPGAAGHEPGGMQEGNMWGEETHFSPCYTAGDTQDPR